MNNGFDAGIDLVAHNLGELPAGKSYLLSGEHGTAKTTFVLQFLHQGLKERRTCVLVSNQPPKALVAHAETMGMNLSPFLKNGTLLMYEIARKDSYSPAELFRELEAVVAENPASRFAFEGLAQSPVSSGPDGSLADGIVALLRKLEGMKTTSFVTLALPVSQPLSPLKEALENAATGSFLLESTSNERVKGFFVRKLAGARLDGAEFPFTVESGRGVVEVMKTSAIKFPRHDGH